MTSLFPSEALSFSSFLESCLAACSRHGATTSEASWFAAAPLLSSEVDQELARYTATFSRRARVFWFSNVGRQRWAHVQPYYKGSRITPGVQSWHCDLQTLLHEGGHYVATHCTPDDIGLGLQLGRAAMMCSTAASLGFVAALYRTLRPSRARLGQWAVDVLALAAGALLVRAQSATLSRCFDGTPLATSTPSSRSRLAAALAQHVGMRADDAVHKLEADVAGLLAELAVTAGPATVAIEAARKLVADWAHGALPIEGGRAGSSPATPYWGVSESHVDASVDMVTPQPQNTSKMACDVFAAAVRLGCGDVPLASLLTAFKLPAAPSSALPPPTPFPVLDARCIFGTPSAAAAVSQVDILSALRHDSQAPLAEGAPPVSMPWSEFASLWSLRGSDSGALLRALHRRHEVGDWEWPVLSPAELHDRLQLTAVILELETLATGAGAVQTPLRPAGVEHSHVSTAEAWLHHDAAVALAGATPAALPFQTGLRDAADASEQSLVGRSGAIAVNYHRDGATSFRPVAAGSHHCVGIDSSVLLSPLPSSALTSAAASPGSVDWGVSAVIDTPVPQPKLSVPMPEAVSVPSSVVFQFPTAVQLVWPRAAAATTSVGLVEQDAPLQQGTMITDVGAPPHPAARGAANAPLVAAAEVAAAASRAAARDP